MDLPEGLHHLRSNQAIQGTTASKTGKVFKVGRTTGLTWGKLLNHWHEENLHPCHPRREIAPQVWDLQVICEDRNPYHVFSQSGDSGSPVMDYDGKFIGMMFGGDATKLREETDEEPSREKDFTYVMAKDVLFAHVKRMTGPPNKTRIISCMALGNQITIWVTRGALRELLLTFQSRIGAEFGAIYGATYGAT